MGEIAEYDLSQISDDDHEDRIADLKRLLDECQAKRASADKRARERLKRVSELEAWVREALPCFYSWHYQGGYHYCEECDEIGNYHGERDSVIHTAHCFVGRGEKLLEGADAEEVI